MTRKQLVGAIEAIKAQARAEDKTEPPMAEILDIAGQLVLDVHDSANALERIATALEKIAIRN